MPYSIDRARRIKENGEDNPMTLEAVDANRFELDRLEYMIEHKQAWLTRLPWDAPAWTHLLQGVSGELWLIVATYKPD
jgi:hypothetical protein